MRYLTDSPRSLARTCFPPQLWSVESGTLIRSFKSLRKGAPAQKEIYACCFAMDAKTVFSAGAASAVTQWSVKSARALRSFVLHSSTVAPGRFYALDVSSDGKYLVGGSSNRSVFRWSLNVDLKSSGTSSDATGAGTAAAPSVAPAAGGSGTKGGAKGGKRGSRKGVGVVQSDRAICNAHRSGWVVSVALSDATSGDVACTLGANGSLNVFRLEERRLLRRIRAPIAVDTPRGGASLHGAVTCHQAGASAPLVVVCPQGRSLAMWSLRLLRDTLSEGSSANGTN